MQGERGPPKQVRWQIKKQKTKQETTWFHVWCFDLYGCMFVFANIITSTKSIKTNLTQVNKSRCWPAGRKGILHICNSDAVFLFSINQCDSAKMDNTFLQRPLWS